MNNSNKLTIFSISIIFSIIFWRAIVFIRAGEVAIIREATGLAFHHYTYGILIVFIAALFLIFQKPNKLSIALMGFGIGSLFDGFISRLFTQSSRTVEIANYNLAFIPTTLLLGILILVSGIFYLWEKIINTNYKNQTLLII